MKLIPLEQLRQHPDLYHQAFAVGRLVDGVNVEVPDDFAMSIFSITNEASKMDMAGNALSALGRIASAILHGQAVLASSDVAEVRKAICDACEHHDRTNGKCRKCGCSTCGVIINKTKLATERCPVGKWA